MSLLLHLRKESTSSRVKPIGAFARAAKACCAPLILGLPVCFSLLAADNPPSEYQVKAAFLLNFTKFIQWPPAAFENADSPFSICILGNDPFGSSLDQVVEGESVGGRKVTVQRIGRPPTPKSCQVLFVARFEKDVPGILAGLGSGVLTVGDREGFIREGGMIAFVLEGRHVRFDINLRAAGIASLTMNSRLLNVARSVAK
jgi:hypothetical protein